MRMVYPCPLMPKNNKQAKLSAHDWEKVGLEIIAKRGVTALAVEPLARKLGVTKGSFYWHYKNRQALLEGVLALWEQVETENVIKHVVKETSPRKRLIALFANVTVDRHDGQLYTSFSASTDPLVKVVVERVNKRRLKFLEECYRDLGLPTKQAKNMSLLAYSTYLGMIQLRSDAPDTVPKDTQYKEMMKMIVEVLVPQE